MSESATEEGRKQAEPAPQRPQKDPLRSFRGVMAGALLLEAIVVGLALPLVDTLGDGVGTAQGALVIGVVVALVLCCAFLRFDWIRIVIGLIQLVLLAGFFSLVAIGIIGLVFCCVWAGLFWMRWDVARRMAAGQLPSQQPTPEQA
ncbi:uncharacterized protein DUF4233 [Tamaricihabitans halophyticus]|uniref:Uncharacterized protein DUF4233 n=1 Tax=Tamaricihabitans halophyticus TaxID=1262583 RepID=A0A4R2QH48_9PSEU|nr:DUF4233 domain-containing protein [Tamaricihabitans halophyticus]TCP48580.1 uncharacterized protein DUF4233 [Tamaricihabitans halophyticus]